MHILHQFQVLDYIVLSLNLHRRHSHLKVLVDYLGLMDYLGYLVNLVFLVVV